MKRRNALPLFGLLALSCAGLSAQEGKLGSKVTELALADGSGKPVTVRTGQGKPTLVLFVSTQCPISNAYNERMNALYRDYRGKGVEFVFVNANANESLDDIAAHSKQNGLTYPTHKDANNLLADRFGAQHTPETFLLGPDGSLVYHGYIDDSREPARVQVKGLRLALDSVLAGKPVERAETKAFGCTIKRVRKTS